MTPRRKKIALFLSVVTACTAMFAAWVVLVPYPTEKLSREAWGSTRIVDRAGVPLRDVLDQHEGRSVWVELDAMSPWLPAVTLAGEDHRFEDHVGVDPWAIIRALKVAADEQRLYSGASTLTMQLTRLVEPRRARTLSAKASEAIDAIRLERAMSKDGILAQYLNRVPYGNGTHGVEAASRLYFGKHARDLSLAEAALLAALPRSPSGYDPYRHLDRAIRRQHHLLGLMKDRGTIDDATWKRAITQTLEFQPRRAPFQAPHFVDAVLDRHPTAFKNHPVQLDTTLDLNLQRQLEHAVERHLTKMRGSGATQAAIVVMDNTDGAVLAMVGSRSWHDSEAHGQVNGALALRQPGSTLKPFTYALAFEEGMTPATVLPDVPTRFLLAKGQTWIPQNFDLRFRGPVRVRDALAGSLNVPAVRALEATGPHRLLDRLHRLGLLSLDKPAGHYGLGLTLGDGEVSLIELTEAYAALARGGLWRPATLLRRPENAAPPRRAFSPEIAHLITDILSDDLARTAAFGAHTPFQFPYPVAVKTGTSAGTRDTWSLGYTPQITVGVWVGRFDGGRLTGLSGVLGAGPLFRETVEIAMQGRLPQTFESPGGLVHTEICALSGHRATEHCPHRREEAFVLGNAPDAPCPWHQHLDIDRRNGLLAGPACSDAVREPQTFVALPPAYDEWATGRGLRTPPTAWSPHCGNHQPPPPTVTITAPSNGEVFLKDPSKPTTVQTIRWMAHTANDVRPDAVRWRLNGAQVALAQTRRRGTHIEGRWQLDPGTHTIEAELPDGTRSDPIEFVVR